MQFKFGKAQGSALFIPWVKGTRQLLMAAKIVPQRVVE